MGLAQIFVWSKKIHRWLLWFVLVLGLWMMISGFLMHEELEGKALLSVPAMLFVRHWHGELSMYFLVVLLLQMCSGLFMWMVPKILSQRAKTPKTTT